MGYGGLPPALEQAVESTLREWQERCCDGKPLLLPVPIEAIMRAHGWVVEPWAFHGSARAMVEGAATIEPDLGVKLCLLNHERAAARQRLAAAIMFARKLGGFRGAYCLDQAHLGWWMTYGNFHELRAAAAMLIPAPVVAECDTLTELAERCGVEVAVAAWHVRWLDHPERNRFIFNDEWHTTSYRFRVATGN